MSELKLWIVVKSDFLKPYMTLKEAIATFDNLETFVTTDSQIVCLTYNPVKKDIWTIEQVPLKEIATAMMAK